MRLLPLTFVTLGSLAASAAAVRQLPCAAAESAQTKANAEVYQDWPFDAVEAERRQVETAKQLGIPVERTLELGNGVKLELVLIPAGTFMMGTEEPEPWDPKPYMAQVVNGYLISVTGGALFLLLIAIVVVRSIRTKTRPQVSLAYLLILTLVAGIGLMGSLQTDSGAFPAATASASVSGWCGWFPGLREFSPRRLPAPSIDVAAGLAA